MAAHDDDDSSSSDGDVRGVVALIADLFNVREEMMYRIIECELWIDFLETMPESAGVHIPSYTQRLCSMRSMYDTTTVCRARIIRKVKENPDYVVAGFEDGMDALRMCARTITGPVTENDHMRMRAQVCHKMNRWWYDLEIRGLKEAGIEDLSCVRTAHL